MFDLYRLVSKEEFEKYDPSYRKVIYELEEKLLPYQQSLDTSATDALSTSALEEAYKIWVEFTKNYMLPKQYWDYFKKIFLSGIKGFERVIFKDRAREQFYFGDWEENPAYMLSSSSPREKKDFDTYYYERNKRWEAITYPHKNLLEDFTDYERLKHFPVTKDEKKKYSEMVKLFEEVKPLYEGKTNEWFPVLCKSGHHLSICENIEYKLGSDLSNKDLWLLYLDYLEREDPWRRREVLSNYCKFFLDDVQMKTEFEKTKNAKITKKQSADDYVYDIRKKPLDQSLIKSFDTTVKSQSFAFRAPFIRYMIEHANATVLRNFHHCCKEFFLRKPIPVCYSVVFTSVCRYEPGYSSESLFVAETEWEGRTILPKKITKFYLSTTLDLSYDYPLKQAHISNIVPYIYKSDIKYCSIIHEQMEFNELKILLEGGNVIELTIEDTYIECEDESLACLEDVLALTPKIEKLDFYDAKISENTSEILCNLVFTGKLSEIKLRELHWKSYGFDKFVSYLNKNRAPFLDVEMSIIYNSKKDYDVHPQKFLTEMLEYGKTENTKVSADLEKKDWYW